MSNVDGPPNVEPAILDETAMGELLERLRASARERGTEYPAELDERLEEHFRRLVFQRSEEHPLASLVESLRDHMAFSRARLSPDSGLPGADVIHKAMNRALARQTDGVLAQVQEFADAVYDILMAIVAALQDPTTHTHGDLVGRIDGVLDRLVSYERAPTDSGVALGDLRRRIEALEAIEKTRGFDPWFTNEEFEERFRGDSEALKTSYGDLADLFGKHSPVLDLGCGRGEFIEMLEARGIEAWGVEIDPQLAKYGRDRGLRVEAGDGLARLASLDDGSLGGLVLLQVVEHITMGQQLELAQLAYDKVRPGGLVVIETVNPQSLYVYAHSFYIDPTHTRPTHPAYLQFLFQQAGFADVGIDWRNAPPKDDQLEVDTSCTGACSRNVERLNSLLFAPGDYAIIARR